MLSCLHDRPDIIDNRREIWSPVISQGILNDRTVVLYAKDLGLIFGLGIFSPSWEYSIRIITLPITLIVALK